MITRRELGRNLHGSTFDHPEKREEMKIKDHCRRARDEFTRPHQRMRRKVPKEEKNRILTGIGRSLEGRGEDGGR